MRSPAPSNPRKRSRAAAVSLATKPSGPDDPPAAKYSAVSKLSRGQPKVGQKPKPLQKSRQGSRLGRNSSDMQFVENCEAIKGSRVGIWWASDNCYYKVLQLNEHKSSPCCLLLPQGIIANVSIRVLQECKVLSKQQSSAFQPYFSAPWRSQLMEIAVFLG